MLKVKFIFNKDIIIYNNFSCTDPAQQEQEKKDFYIEFFWRNAADPQAEVEKFIGYNDSLGWKNDKGRCYDTPEKRLGLAKFWEFKTEGHWARPEYLKAIKAIYQSAVEEGVGGVEAIINHKVTLIWNGQHKKWVWMATPEARRWVEANAKLVHKHLDPVTVGRTVSWEMIKAS